MSDLPSLGPLSFPLGGSPEDVGDKVGRDKGEEVDGDILDRLTYRKCLNRSCFVGP